jgi:hypothetical protein
MYRCPPAEREPGARGALAPLPMAAVLATLKFSNV